MAFSNNPSDLLDEMRYRNQPSSRHEVPMLGMVSPPRNGARLPPPSHANDARAGLPRRFTTDSGRVPTLNSLASQRAQETQEYATSTYHKVQLLGKKKLEYERLREQKRRFEAEMQILDLQQRQEEQELARMQEDLSSGHQSEPTTPPEYIDTNSGFPSVFSRPNRYSTSSINSSLSVYNRPSRSGSQLTSPQLVGLGSRYMKDDKLPSKSVPGSRRNSDEDEKEEAVRQDPTSHRSTNALNRYSMPVTKSRNGMNEMLSLDQTNTTRFLFGDEENSSSTDVKGYLQMNANDENFPILVRHNSQSQMPTASSAALDLASPQSPGQDSTGWSTYTRHRHSQHSLPGNNLGSINGQNGTNGPGSQVAVGSTESPSNGRPTFRHSLDMKYYEDSAEQVQMSSPSKVLQTPPKLQSSYSANDVPTMKSTSNGVGSPNSTTNSHAQQHLHNHNASLGRIPPNAVSNRQSRDYSGSSGEISNTTARDGPISPFQSISSALQPNAPAFGPILSHGGTQQSQYTTSNAVPNSAQFSAQGGYYNNFTPQNMQNMQHIQQNMQLMTMGMQNMQMGQQNYQQNPYPSYGNVYPQNGMRDSQARVIQQRRQTDGEAMSRFANVSLDQLGGEIYSLCKDQHGCRYLQKKLEERIPEHVHAIWLETNQHVVELMTDPFGNYLCQKLLEYCNDEERTVLIQNASVDLVRIALNQHGTRALQKMIEFISTPGQVDIIIDALRYQVVELIQDLNGNHVIQKCLNKLTATDAQFIFEAVGNHCVDVGTHRHGCCVLQRCIDHASGDQKAWLIRKISENAFNLVQDPFGNYVVQYILDLNEPLFTEPLVRQFEGRIGQLSRQKFSSNVIEKCLRCAQEPSKDMMIEEMLNPTELDRLLRDSFANYVIQTALDYASPETKTRLIEAIRPYLPAIRATPYGRRIQAKIQGVEGRSSSSSGQATPNDSTTGQLPLRQIHQRGLSNTSTNSFSPTSPGFTNGYNNQNMTPSRNATVTFPSSAQIAAGQIPQISHISQASNPPYLYGHGAPQPGTGAGNYF